MLRAGIVGLPNVGKSTLFNAVTRTRNAEAANYPFCTIDPNVGIVTVPDARLAELARIAKTSVIIPAAIEFVDIAGLVKGASQGEGLGNKFLTHIREVDAIIQVVRCFEDPDVLHVSTTVDPVRDIEVINTELALADIEQVSKRRERLAKDIKRGEKGAAAEDAVLAKIEAALNAGKPALTWWQGAVINAHGEGVGEIGDDSFRSIKTIRAGHGLTTDLHDLQLTARGTALITAYETATADLTSIGKSSKGQVFVGHVQEIDLNTGRVLFDWRSLDHVGIEDSFQPPPLPGQGYDYFHLNSVAEMDDGHLLISARNTCTLYKVDRSTGQILWRMGGKHSDFSVSSDAVFWWQHDARPHGLSAISLLDNEGPHKGKQSRGLVLSVDSAAKRVDLTRAFVHPAGFITATLGNVDLQSDGGVFIGWGAQSYFSHYASDGTMILDGELPIGVRSYRAHLVDFVGHPADGPRVVAQENPAGGFAVHASWNGATEVARWTVLAGSEKSAMSEVGSQAWTGFETAIAVNSNGPYFGVVALDSNGRELGRSPIA